MSNVVSEVSYFLLQLFFSISVNLSVGCLALPRVFKDLFNAKCIYIIPNALKGFMFQVCMRDIHFKYSVNGNISDMKYRT